MAELPASMLPRGRPRVEEFPAWVEPLDVLDAARDRRHAVLLLSASPTHPESRFSIFACDPERVLAIRGQEARLARSDGREERLLNRDPLDLLRRFAPADPTARAEGLPFVGGAIGCLGYGLRKAIESLPLAPPDPLEQPDAWFGLYRAVAIFDARDRRVALVATDVGDRAEATGHEPGPSGLNHLRGILYKARAAPAGVAPSRPAAPRRLAMLTTSRQDYLARIDRARRYIAAGDVYQVNLSHRIECPFEGDPIDLFRRLAEINPAPFAAFIDAGRFQVISASPERFVSIEGGRVRSSPIKGTRPRGATPDEDRRLAEELLKSSKDRAENVMIADLVRSDIGRVSEPGSVKVVQLCALESFATVHHLVSTIEGRLLPGRDRIDVLRALFPGGSMTGAPKVRAMEVIDELEGEERGIYSGGVGYLSFDGRVDFSIVIRTLICQAGRAHLRVGGGIVADSDPEQEFRETLDKGRVLLQVLEASLRT